MNEGKSMSGKLKERNLKQYAMLTRLLLSMITIDAAYLYWTVEKMAENVPYALEQYHAVPIMAEHVLAAVVLYLICMMVMDKVTET